MNAKKGAGLKRMVDADETPSDEPQPKPTPKPAPQDGSYKGKKQAQTDAKRGVNAKKGAGSKRMVDADETPSDEPQPKPTPKPAPQGNAKAIPQKRNAKADAKQPGQRSQEVKSKRSLEMAEREDFDEESYDDNYEYTSQADHQKAQRSSVKRLAVKKQDAEQQDHQQTERKRRSYNNASDKKYDKSKSVSSTEDAEVQERIQEVKLRSRAHSGKRPASE